MSKQQTQPKPRRRRLCFRCTRPQADASPALAVLARFAAILERGAHNFPVADWAELLALVNPLEYFEPPTPEAPTTHLAGSDGKLAVMMGRIARGLSPFHPDDGMRAWREFICPELVGDGWGLAVEQRDGRVRGVKAIRLQGRREPVCEEA
jgi:hypothetical protein